MTTDQGEKELLKREKGLWGEKKKLRTGFNIGRDGGHFWGTKLFPRKE